jgi:S-(hydroxymethyl)glutathione dehydrogenase / alcohol dehydrogenase
MRAAILKPGESKLHVVNDIAVRDPKPGEVRVRVAYCGLCHSDLSIIRSASANVPVVLGHEAAGTVDAVGAGVTQVAPGDLVVLTTKPSCGRCYWCAKGHPTVCVNNQNTGLSTPLPDGTSGMTQEGREIHRGVGVAGFSEMVLTTVDSLAKVDAGTPLDIAAVLGCAVRTGVGAVINTAQVQAGDSVLVMGLGGVGQSVVMGAKLASAAVIIVSDPVPARRAAAIEFGADVAVDPLHESVVDIARRETSGRGVDFAFDAVGSSALIQTGFDAIGPAGAVVLVGVGKDQTYPLPIRSMVVNEKRVLGSLIGTSLVHRDVPRLLSLWRAGRLDLERLITARRPIEEINEGFDDMSNGVGVRTVVSFA